VRGVPTKNLVLIAEAGNRAMIRVLATDRRVFTKISALMLRRFSCAYVGREISTPRVCAFFDFVTAEIKTFRLVLSGEAKRQKQ
jgi:hypothetical protein